MSVTASTSGSQTLTDSASGTTPFSKAISGSFAGTASAVGQQVQIGTTPVSIQLPVSPTHYVYVKNLSGVATVTVTWTPNGGASATILLLEPGSYIQFVEAATGAGITALTLTASAVSTPVEFLLAG